MFESLIPLIQAAIKNDRILEDIREIHRNDRWFNYPSFHKTAAYARRRLKQAGASDCQIIEFPADGKTMCGTWQAGFAWDATEATLTVISPPSKAGTRLADYRETPCSLAMWSAPTPEDGVEADVIDVGEGTSQSDFDHKPIRGNIVLANSRAVSVKGLAAANGAIGILIDWVPQQERNMDAVFWSNAFADTPMGWPLTEGASRMFGFGMSRRAGLELRESMQDGKTVRVRAVVKTRIYDGTFPVVTGLLPGTTSEEVLALGHAFEQGAKDNASGVACIMEALRVLAALIKSGKLKRPRRGIRALVTNECFGTISYVDRFPDCKTKTVAAICLDEAGIDRKTEPEVQALFVNPQSNASYLDALAATLAEAIWKRPYFNPYVVRPYGSSDNMIAHPSIGIPSLWMGCHGSRITWHTTIDTPERMSPGQLGAAAAYTAVYLYFLANAGEKEAAWLGELAIAAGLREMLAERVAVHANLLAASPNHRQKILAEFAERLDYLSFVHENAATSALRLSPAKSAHAAVNKRVKDLPRLAQQLLTASTSATKKTSRKKNASPFGTVVPAQAMKVRPAFAFSGPITYDPIPINKRDGHADPRWGTPVNVALGWANGKRTLAETIFLAEHELKHALPGLAEEMLWVISKGLIKNAAKQIP